MKSWTYRLNSLEFDRIPDCLSNDMEGNELMILDAKSFYSGLYNNDEIELVHEIEVYFF